jgi:hypothetical protein
MTELGEKSQALVKDAPEELFKEKYNNNKPVYTNESNSQRFNNLVKTYFGLKPTEKTNYELEVRFGTINQRNTDIKPLNKNDYDNVIKKLKALGFRAIDESGEYSLRVQTEFINKHTGKYEESNTRVEIYGLDQIQYYCKSNDDLAKLERLYDCIKFTKKKPVFVESKGRIDPVFFNDFNFKVSLQEEETPNMGLQHFIVQSWKEIKKSFRHLNRVTFVHDDYPVKVDLSIVKTGNRDMKKVYYVADSGVFKNPERYEIEIEIDNDKIGPGHATNTPELLLESLRKVIKFVLGGLQKTNFPVSYYEQSDVLKSYEKLVHTGYFIGPSSVTLQMANVAPIDANMNVINIRKDYTVTEKADGERNLMFIDSKGKIYLISNSMNVSFTGAITDTKECFDSILDGELITHNKNKEFINLYAAFDIYYIAKENVQALSFIDPKKDAKKDAKKSRLILMKDFIKILNPKSVIKPTIENPSNRSPITITSKEFYPLDHASESIFDACRMILMKIKDGLFEYNTDGLIFTPTLLGVGSDKVGAPRSKSKTWKYSFKWKPPEYNTIDFLVTTIKQKQNNDDLIQNVMRNDSISEYKTIQLRCSYNPSQHGYINPCQYILNDETPKGMSDESSKNVIPAQFYPTSPYDVEAGIANILLQKDEHGDNQMITTEGDVFTDNTIVEFSYNKSGEKGWCWEPLRVRYDKTTEMLNGKRNFGNAYHVANDNWKSIHYPITEEMIASGDNIPDNDVTEDKYYNNTSREFKTDNLKLFHNLFVKKKLIKSVSSPNDTLIDYACGKAGDLSKWINSELSFVFGIDIHKDNLENNKNGACVRVLESRMTNKSTPSALFVNGNSSHNIKDGTAMMDDKAILITRSVFALIKKDEHKMDKALLRLYGKGEDGFNVSSCQFALHYFFETPDSLKGFMRNVSECTKLEGYFIGTAYDGRLLFDKLRKYKNGESIQIVQEGTKVWEVTKRYDESEFTDDSSSIGYKIDVYQDSINKTFSEYLINFDYMTRVLEMYGFKLLPRDEAVKLGLPNGSGSFEELFHAMNMETKNKPSKLKDYGTSHQMRDYEKEISFLNKYFVYKKIRHVNTEKVELELEEYRQKQYKVGVGEKAATILRKKNANVKKLGTKLVLKGAVDARGLPDGVDVSKGTMKDESAAVMKVVSSIEKMVLEPVPEQLDAPTDALSVLSEMTDSVVNPVKKKRLTLKKRVKVDDADKQAL